MRRTLNDIASGASLPGTPWMPPGCSSQQVETCERDAVEIDFDLECERADEEDDEA